MKWTRNNKLNWSTQIGCDQHTFYLFTPLTKAMIQTEVDMGQAACSI